LTRSVVVGTPSGFDKWENKIEGYRLLEGHGGRNTRIFQYLVNIEQVGGGTPHQGQGDVVKNRCQVGNGPFVFC